MTRYTIDSEAVATAASSMTGTVERLRGEANSLQTQIDALQASWTGQAAVAFQGVVHQWRATQANLEEVLTSIQLALRTAGEQYAAIELANARLFAV